MAFDAGTVFVNVVANTAAFRAQMATLGSSMISTGATINRIGGLLTKTFTIPLGLAGYAATKLALDYEQAFVKINAITNIKPETVARWKKQTQQLAAQTAQAPQDLADALYFLASAGLDTNKVMDVLSASAHAAAIGLGDTADIAKLTANAMVAYEKSGLGATEVTNTLVAAVREGTAEPDEFATAMGRILPIAAKAKIEFDDVAGSLSQLSNIGLDVNEGVTALRGLLKALYVPGTQAVETLHSIGLSVDQVRSSLSKQGIVETIRLLEDAAKKSAKTPGEVIDTLSKIIPNIRALTGVFGLSIQKVNDLDAAMKRVQHATGDTNEAFKVTAKGPMFQLQQGITRLKNAGISLGEQLIPIVLDVVDSIASLAKGFSGLSDSTQQFIVKAGIVLVLLGPLVRLFGGLWILTGSVVKVVAALFRPLTAAATAMTGLGTASWTTAGGLSAVEAEAGALAGLAGPIAAGAAIVVGALVGIKIANDNANEAIDKNVELLRQGVINVDDLKRSNDQLATSIQQATTDQNKQGLAARFASGEINGARNQIDANNESINRFGIGIRSMLEGFGVATGSADQWADSLTEIGNTTEIQRHHIAKIIGSFQAFGKSVDASTRNLVLDKLRLGDVSGAIKLLKDRYDKVVGPIIRAGEATAKHAKASEHADHVQRLLAGGVKNAEAAIKQAANAASRGSDDVKKLGDKLKEVGQQHPKPSVKIDTSQPQNALSALETRLENLTQHSWQVNVHLSTTGGSTGFELLAELTKVLTAVTEEDWVASVQVALKDFAGNAFDLPKIKSTVGEMQKVLKTLVSSAQTVADQVKSAIGEKLPKAYADSARALQQMVQAKNKHFTKLVNAATKAFDKIKAKADEFRSSIASAFDQFDLLGGALGLGDVLKEAMQPQIEALKAELETVKDQTVIEDHPHGPPALSQDMIDAQAADIEAQIKALEEAIIIPTADQLKEFFRQQVDQAGQFAEVLKNLQLAGLDPKLLADIASKGISALPFAQQLLSDPTLLAAFETAQNAITAFAQKTSDALTTAQFGEKMKKMAKNVDDLNDTIQHFNNRMEKRMEELVQAIKSEQIANKLDQFINAMDRAISRLDGGGGGKNGKSAQLGFHGRLLRDTTFSAHSGEFVDISHSGGGGDGGVTVYLNVEGNAVYAHDLANEVRDILLKDKRYKRTLGLA